MSISSPFDQASIQGNLSSNTFVLSKIEFFIQHDENINIPAITFEFTSKDGGEFDYRDLISFFSKFGEVEGLYIKMQRIIILFKSFLSAATCKSFLSQDSNYKQNMKQFCIVKWFRIEENQDLISPEEKEKFQQIINQNLQKIQNSSFSLETANSTQNPINPTQVNKTINDDSSKPFNFPNSNISSTPQPNISHSPHDKSPNFNEFNTSNWENSNNKDDDPNLASQTQDIYRNLNNLKNLNNSNNNINININSVMNNFNTVNNMNSSSTMNMNQPNVSGNLQNFGMNNNSFNPNDLGNSNNMNQINMNQINNMKQMNNFSHINNLNNPVNKMNPINNLSQMDSRSPIHRESPMNQMNRMNKMNNLDIYNTPNMNAFNENLAFMLSQNEYGNLNDVSSNNSMNNSMANMNNSISMNSSLNNMTNSMNNMNNNMNNMNMNNNNMNFQMQNNNNMMNQQMGYNNFSGQSEQYMQNQMQMLNILQQNQMMQNPNNMLQMPQVEEKGKYTCKYEILIPNDNKFQIVKKIIGSKGVNMKRIIDNCTMSNPQEANNQVKLRLRGRGSGFKEGPSNVESDEPLHLCVSAKTQKSLSQACYLVEELFSKIYEEYKALCEQNYMTPLPSIYQRIEGGSTVFNKMKSQNNFNSNVNNGMNDFNSYNNGFFLNNNNSLQYNNNYNFYN